MCQLPDKDPLCTQPCTFAAHTTVPWLYICTPCMPCQRLQLVPCDQHQHEASVMKMSGDMVQLKGNHWHAPKDKENHSEGGANLNLPEGDL